MKTRQTIHNADCLDWMQSQPARIVDLTITSPPYEDARTYGIGFRLKGAKWVEWCLPRVVEMCRITNGLVIFNASGKVRKFKYSPVVEWLVSDLTRHHGIVCGPAPYVFSRVGIPGSGSKHYHRRDWEPCYAFALPDRLPLAFSNNTAMGHPPKWAPGGLMSHRHADGRRKNHSAGPVAHERWGKNQWGGNATSCKTRRANGQRQSAGRPSHQYESDQYIAPVLANPGNVIHGKVGGGHMGSPLAHDNEAPFPEWLVEFFVRSYAPIGGKVFDPFAGSGTTLAVAKRTNRHGIGCEIRSEQCDIVRRRLATVQPELFE